MEIMDLLREVPHRLPTGQEGHGRAMCVEAARDFQPFPRQFGMCYKFRRGDIVCAGFRETLNGL